MSNLITWEQTSIDPQNPALFLQIQQWWENLRQQEVLIAQRLIPETGNLQDIDWSTQRFDEKCKLQNVRIGGITLYWTKLDEDLERSITPRKLEFKPQEQQLYIYSQSQKQLVIRVALASATYTTLNLNYPQVAGTKLGENRVILLRDNDQKIEVKVVLNPFSIEQLRNLLT